MKRAAFLCLLLAFPAGAQEEDAAPEITFDLHEVRLKSRTVLVGRIEPEAWKVRTAFGELKVPVRRMRLVKFGRRSDPDRLADVANAITDLASANPERRAHAQARLREQGPFAALDLQAAAKGHADAEVRRVCGEMLDEMGLEPEQFVPDEDRIETTQFSIAGTVVPDSFKVDVVELGAISVQRKDIVHVRAYSPSRAVKATVSGTNMWPNGWVDTGFKLKKGQAYRVTAGGTIHFPNWGGQVSTPDGNRNMGNYNGMLGGTLAGRIGKNGKHFRLGSSYRGKAPVAGNLEVCVMLNLRGQPTTGEYNLRIDLEDED